MTSSQHPQVTVTLSEGDLLTLPPAFVSLTVETICPEGGMSKALRREFLRPEGYAYFDASCVEHKMRTLVKATPTALAPVAVVPRLPDPSVATTVDTVQHEKPTPQSVPIPNVTNDSWGAKGLGAAAGVVASGILGTGLALGLLALAGGPSTYAPEVAKFGGGSAMLGSVLSLPHGLLFTPKATETTHPLVVAQTDTTKTPLAEDATAPQDDPAPQVAGGATVVITQRQAARPVEPPPKTLSERLFGRALSTIHKSTGANDKEKALLESDAFTQRRLGKYFWRGGTPARGSAQHEDDHIVVEVLPPENDVKAAPEWLVLGKDKSNMSLWRAASSEAANDALKTHEPPLTIDARGAVAHPDAKVHNLLQWWRSAPPHYNPVSANSHHFAADVASRIERNTWEEHHPSPLPYVVAGVCLTAACAVVWRRSALRTAKPRR